MIICGDSHLTPFFLALVCEGERLGRGIVTDALTTPVMNTSAHFFKKSDELIESKVCIALIQLHFSLNILSVESSLLMW